MDDETILTKDEIRDTFLKNGFRIKEGETDLMPYVYLAAQALIDKTVENLKQRSK